MSLPFPLQSTFFGSQFQVFSPSRVDWWVIVVPIVAAIIFLIILFIPLYAVSGKNLFVRPFVCLSVWLSVHLFVCLSVNLSGEWVEDL